MLFLCTGERTDQTGKPLDPFLVAYECRPAHMFVCSKAELEVFPGCFEIAVKLKIGKLQNQADGIRWSQTLAECIEELLVIRAGHFSAEPHSQAAWGGLREDLYHGANNTPPASTTIESTTNRTRSSMTNFIQVPNPTRAMARPPMTTAEVGVIRFTSPLAAW